jgi:hypothetical protein
MRAKTFPRKFPTPLSNLKVSFCLCLAIAGCGLDENLDRSDKPVSRAQASKVLGMALPSSAKDVYYLVHSGGMQEFEMCVRFTVDPKELDGAVSEVLSNHNQETKQDYNYPSRILGVAPRPPSFSEFQPMPWWNPESISNGYYRGSTNGQPFHVWVDVGFHTIYLCSTD